MKKIYMAGCGGMLGEAFYKVFNQYYDVKCTDIDLNEKWLSYCDFRDFEMYNNDVIAYKPDYLFHIGAFTDLEFCELHPEETYITNEKSVEHAVKISNSLKIPVLYISTAGIFDGSKDVYDDFDLPAPLCQYAKTKYAGEKYVENNANAYLIFRAGWMMGGGPKKDKKFIHKIMSQINSGQKELFIVNDKFGTPTYTHDFAANVRLVLESGKRGLYKLVCEGLTSRLDVAKKIIFILGLTDEVIITQVSSEHFAKEYFVKRPYSERLINKKLSDAKLNIMRSWEVAIEEYLTEYYNNYLD